MQPLISPEMFTHNICLHIHIILYAILQIDSLIKKTLFIIVPNSLLIGFPGVISLMYKPFTFCRLWYHGEIV